MREGEEKEKRSRGERIRETRGERGEESVVFDRGCRFILRLRFGTDLHKGVDVCLDEEQSGVDDHRDGPGAPQGKRTVFSHR